MEKLTHTHAHAAIQVADEKQEAKELSAPTGKVVYRTILREGKHELERASAALFWSGLAAGLSMGLSMIMEGLLASHLPNASWAPLVAKLGYSAGFLVIILGRHQLFTENTLTPILPLLQHRNLSTLRNVLRLWSILLFANLLGAFILALTVAKTSAFSPEAQAAFAEIGHKALSHDFGTILIRGIFAGWLIALMAWILPFAESARVLVIIFITYLVGIGGFSHVIAGSVETFTLAAMGQAGWGEVLGSYVVPALIGNILGGVILVSLLNHGQITAGEAEENLAASSEHEGILLPK